MGERKRVAILVAANIYNQKGLFNAVHNRCMYLMRVADYDIDVFLLSSYKGRIISLFTHKHYLDRPLTYKKDDITYNILWRKNSIIDYFAFHKLHKREPIHALYNKRIVPKFKNYDLLDVHSGCGTIALAVKEKYGVPYVITWHGSDIHTVSNNKSVRIETERVIKNANCNFFVSSALAEQAKTISNDFVYKILYNGVNPSFRVFPEVQRAKLRQQYGVDGKKVVVFAGNIIEVKNPFSLPNIFKAVKTAYHGDVVFWIIGDGALRSSLERKMKENDVNAVFWGSVKSDEMPQYLQCADVSILCSYNEGFGLFLLEALTCGSNAVSSRVGGTLELLGMENTFPLDDRFISNISNRIVYMLNNNVIQPTNPKFSWEYTANLEDETIHSVLGL